MKERQFRHFDVNGVRLRAVVEGEGPLCVLVHGWPESWYSWRHQIDPLIALGYQVCVPDVRGYGGSDKPQAIEAYDMPSMMGDVVGLIDALGARDAVLIGHDWGAPIVWNTAIVHRERVRAVVGLSVPHLGLPKRPLVEIYKKQFEGLFFYQLYFQEPGVAEREFEADVRSSLLRNAYLGSGTFPLERMIALAQRPPNAKFFDGVPTPERLDWLTEEDLDYYTHEFEQSGFRGPINRYRNSHRDHAALSQLANERITQPALFITGSRDPVLYFVAGAGQEEAMKPWYDDLRGVIVLDGIGHWTQQEAPAAVNEALKTFLLGL